MRFLRSVWVPVAASMLMVQACGGGGGQAAPATQPPTTATSAARATTTTPATAPSTPPVSVAWSCPNLGEAATSIAASAATPSSDEYPEDLLRVGGFSGFRSGPAHYWQGVLWIENESSQTIVIDSGEFVFRDVTGAVIDTRAFSQRILYPGVNYVGVDMGRRSRESPELIEVIYDEAEFIDAGRFTISNVLLGTSILTVSGDLTSSFNEHRDNPELLAVFFDVDGKPLYATDEHLRGERVEPGTTPLDFTFGLAYEDALERAPGWDHIEVYAHPSAWDPSPSRDRIDSTRSLSSTAGDPGVYPGDSLRLAGFSGYSTGNPSGSFWQGVVWVENESSETIVIDSGEFVFRSASGAVIEISYFSERILYPGVNYLGVGYVGPASPESIEVRYHEAEFFDAGKFTISNVDTSATSGGFDVAFEIAHDFCDAKASQLLFVFFDADGHPLFSYLNDVGAIEPTGFEQFVWSFGGGDLDGAPAWDHVEVYGHPSTWDPSPRRDRIDSTLARVIPTDSP